MSGRKLRGMMSLCASAVLVLLVQASAVADVSKADTDFYNSELKTVIDYLASFGGDKSDPYSPAGAAKLLSEKLANGQIEYRNDLPPGELGENNWPQVDILVLSTSAFLGSSKVPIKFDPKNPTHAKMITSILSTFYHELIHSLRHSLAYRMRSNLRHKLRCGNTMEVFTHVKATYFMLDLAKTRKAQLEDMRKKLPKNDPKILLALEEIIALNSAGLSELGAIFENNYLKDEELSGLLKKTRGRVNEEQEALRRLADSLKKSADDAAAEKTSGDQSSVPPDALKDGRPVVMADPDRKTVDAAIVKAETQCTPKTAVRVPPATEKKKTTKKVAVKKRPRRTAGESPPAQSGFAPSIQFGVGFGGSSSHPGGGQQHHQDGGRVGGR